jgi:hypothetical protein
MPKPATNRPAAAKRYADDEFVAQTKSYLSVQVDPEKGADNEFANVYKKFQEQMILHTPAGYKRGTFKDRDAGIVWRYHR